MDAEFVPHFPCFFFLQKRSVEFDKSGKAIRYVQPLMFVGLVAADHDHHLPVFTDDDWADRFANELSDPQAIKIMVPDAEKLVVFLKSAKDAFPKVVFDPEVTKQSRRIWDINYVIHQLQKGIGLASGL